MARVKRGTTKNKRKSKILKLAKGFRNARSTKFKQAKLVNVLKGKILDYVIDLRKSSRTFGESFGIEISEKNCISLKHLVLKEKK